MPFHPTRAQVEAELYRRVEQLEAAVIPAAAAGAGFVAGRLAPSIARPLAGAAARLPVRLAITGLKIGKTFAMSHPLITTLGVIYIVYTNPKQVEALLDQGFEFVEETVPKVKRGLSKANKAVKEAMRLLKAGTKSQTGARPGILPFGAFAIATKAAGLASPNTASKVGKGMSTVKKLARKLKQWW